MNAAREEDAIDASVFDVFRSIDDNDGADGFVAQLIEQYLVEATARMAVLKDAIERRDAPAVKMATHTLKGASSTVGARKLAALCNDLEAQADTATFDGTLTLATS